MKDLSARPPSAPSAAEGGATFEKRDPATGALVAEIECTSPAELARIVRTARAAQPGFAALSFDERAARLARGAERLAAAAPELADLATREMGKLHGDALREARGWVAQVPELVAEVRAAIEPEIYRANGELTRVEREPHGVVAAIAPWNFPIAMPLSILIPALATGNAVVFKPSEHVPLTGARLAACFAQELPAGVLQVVQGGGATGAALVALDVDMIAFVGSRATGVSIMKAASDGLKRLVLELGGKDPLVVFADADLEAAAECAVRHSLRNTGQVCCAVERVYVAEPVAQAFEALVVAKARAWKHGSGFDESAKMGPLVSAEQRAKVALHVDDARARGARVLLGGKVPDGPGWFYPATVLADVQQDWPVAQEETFGPVVCLVRFDGSEAEAIRLANDTPYGLGASVYTRDSERGRRVARAIRSGQVGVNRYLAGAPGTPWVGARQSGFGFLGGRDGHLQFTTPKTISCAQEAP